MFWLIIIGCVVLDQLTKWIVVKNMALGQSIDLPGGLLDITFILNDGAAFSMLEGQRTYFIILTVAVFAIICWLHRSMKKEDPPLDLALAFFLGGTLGNFIDRVWLGAVIDFFELGWFMDWFPIFNVADCFLTLSTAFICVYLLFGPEGVILKCGGKK